MTDLDRFLAAMDGEWEVVEHKIDDGRVRVFYRSKINPLITWSHLPIPSGMCLAPVGTVGRICFTWKRPAP